MNSKTGPDSVVHAAAFGAAALIASQVAGKAVRDAFFLSHFEVSALPGMVILAAILAIAAGLVAARLIGIFAPSRLLPIAFIGSSTLLLMEWGIASISPRVAAVLIYLQMSILGSVLISGFWSSLADRFDARSAKKQFGRIVAASALGGAAGGFLAERVGSSVSITSVLPVLAFLHLVCAWISSCLSPKQTAARRPAPRPARKPLGSFLVLGTVPYVRNLALLILFSTMGTALIDYVFKVRVSTAYADGEQLIRLFAVFYAVVGVATFLVQLILSRVAVEKLGIAGTVGSLPVSLALGGIGGLLAPGLGMVFAIRGSETMVRGSLFKSGYEMLYAAIPRRERQATKSVLDIGVERIADLLGAVLLGVISWAVAPRATTIILTIATVLGGAGFWISRRLQKGYIQALEKSLLHQPATTQAGKQWTYGGILRTFVWRKTNAGREESASVEPPVTNAARRDPILMSIKDLRSGDPAMVRKILRQPVSPVLTPHIIALLAWNDVATDAIEALKRIGPRITGQLVDALLDPDQEFAVRRRIPRVLAEFDLQRAADGLTRALADTRFEVRFHSGYALAQIRTRNPQIAVDREAIIRAVEREFDLSPEVWRHQRVLDTTHDEPAGAIAVDHVFRLLGFAYPSEPLQNAYRALRSGDDYLRRTSLEYLEQILPLGVWQHILPLVDEKNTESQTTLP